jgi:hypothetical protein
VTKVAFLAPLLCRLGNWRKLPEFLDAGASMIARIHDANGSPSNATRNQRFEVFNRCAVFCRGPGGLSMEGSRVIFGGLE